MTDEVSIPALRLVAADPGADPTASAEGAADPSVDEDPLAALVQRIDDLPLRERSAAFERVNANLVAELNALEEV